MANDNDFKLKQLTDEWCEVSQRISDYEGYRGIGSIHHAPMSSSEKIAMDNELERLRVRKREIEAEQTSLYEDDDQKIEPINDTEREGKRVPEELDIAMIAWRAAYKGIKQGEKPGVYIRTWLAKNYPHLKDEARKRIAIVANWDKSPGASKK